MAPLVFFQHQHAQHIAGQHSNTVQQASSIAGELQQVWAGVLQAFPWNDATHARGKPAVQAAAALDPLCPICTAPLTDAEVEDACQSAVRRQALSAHFSKLQVSH